MNGYILHFVYQTIMVKKAHFISEIGARLRQSNCYQVMQKRKNEYALYQIVMIKIII